jgi:chromosome segregation ATPase
MDQDQLIKQVEWLDKERRDDKKAITALQKKVVELEGLLEKSNSAIKDANSEITRLNVVVAKVDQFEGVMSEHRAGVKNEIDAQERRAKQREKTVKKGLSEDIDQVRTNLAGFEHEIKMFDKLPTELTKLQEEALRRDGTLRELQQQIDLFSPGIEENKDLIRIVQEERIGSQKRVTDIVGEVSALRNKLDELRGKLELFYETNRKTETRISDLIATEEERRVSQLEYIESISLENEKREKTWKNWEKRFAEVEEQAESIAPTLRTFNEAERAVQKAQEDLESITEQINRRIHEITEMQRLGEERFRQEWNTFKSDDQKRWANYALTQDEQTKETSRRFERLSERSTVLEEITQDMQDTVQHTNEQFEKLMQGFLATMRDWLATTERYTDSVS